VPGAVHGNKRGLARQAPTHAKGLPVVARHALPKDAAKGLRRLKRWQVVHQVDLADRPLEIVEHRATRYADPKMKKFFSIAGIIGSFGVAAEAGEFAFRRGV